MQVSSRWRTASLVAGALLIGSVFGPPLARAAAAGLVRIEGRHSSNLAAVSRSGQLSVNAGLTTTKTGQVTVAAASPANAVVVFSGQNCNAGGIYTIPAGKALIITSADFYNFVNSSGEHFLSLFAGPSATPCTSFLASSVATDPDVSQNQVFNPGIPVPAGDVLGLRGTNDNGTISVYGYLVPAAGVPHNVLKKVRAGAPGRLAAVTPPA